MAGASEGQKEAVMGALIDGGGGANSSDFYGFQKVCPAPDFYVYNYGLARDDGACLRCQKRRGRQGIRDVCARGRYLHHGRLGALFHKEKAQVLPRRFSRFCPDRNYNYILRRLQIRHGAAEYVKIYIIFAKICRIMNKFPKHYIFSV